MFNCKTIEEARKRRDSILADYQDVAESDVECLENGFEEEVTAMELPWYLRKYFRTYNQIERLNKELKRRSKDIGVFPNEESLMRPMGAVQMERNEKIENTRRVFKEEKYREIMMEELQKKLTGIAEEERKLLAS